MTATTESNRNEHAANSRQAVEFLSYLFEPGDYILFRPIESWIDSNGRKRSKVDYEGIVHPLMGMRDNAGVWHPTPDRTAATVKRQAERAEATKANVFFSVCPRVGGGGQYDLAWQIRKVRVLWADVDDCGPDEAIQRCEKAGLPKPSIVVASGNGAHLYWLLDAPYLIDDVGDPPAVHVDWIEQGNGKKKKRQYLIDSDTEERLYLDAKQNVPELSQKAQRMQDIVAGIASKIGGDHTQDLSRLLRVPGTLNRKDQRNGREPVPCELVECHPDQRYAIDLFQQYADASPSKAEREQLAKVKLPAPRKLSAGRQDRFHELVTACGVVEVGLRSGVDYSLCCYAVEHGQTAAEVWGQVHDVGKFAEGGERYFRLTWEAAEKGTREKIFDRVKRKAAKSSEKKSRAADRTADDGRRTILVDFDEPRVVDEAVQALTTADNAFQRGGMLVQVVQDAPPPRGIARPAGAPRIAPLKSARLRELLATVANWERPGGEDGNQPCHPPEWVVKAVDARGQWAGIRPIMGVVEAPVLRADSTVLQEPGYDPQTGLIYRPEIQFPPIPEQPSRADAQRARDALLEVVEDFPFASETHRAAWGSGILTPLSRFAFPGPAPLHLIDANVRGCGKSLLADGIAVIVFGRDMARMTAPREEEEFRKRITALAIAGEPSILLDNVADILGGPSLDAALTATSWSDRILGLSEMASGIPLFATWYATGNNVVLLADTARRTLHVRLESPEESPEERTGFRHPDLLAWVRSERARLVAAALTILRAYCAAGRPDMELKPWGSFEAWSGLVRQSIVWCGLPDPGETRQELANHADTEATALRQLISGWERIDPEGYGLTVAAVLDAIEALQKRPGPMPEGYDDIRNAIIELVPTRGGKFPTARSVGMKLNRLRRRVVGGRCLDKKGDCHGNYWYVATSEPSRTKRTKRTIPATPCEPKKLKEKKKRMCAEATGPHSPRSPHENPADGNGSPLPPEENQAVEDFLQS